MKKAVPKPTRPRGAGKIHTGPDWLRKIESHDRNVRRREKIYRDHFVRLSPDSLKLIDNSRKLDLTGLNRLGPVRSEDEYDMHYVGRKNDSD